MARPHRQEGPYGRWWLWVGGPVPPGASAITIWNVVSVRTRAADDQRLIDHELVHVRQWREHGPVGFLVRYVRPYLRWRLRGYGHWAAYRRIPFEIEADWEARRKEASDASAPAAPASGSLG